MRQQFQTRVGSLEEHLQRLKSQVKEKDDFIREMEAKCTQTELNILEEKQKFELASISSTLD